jgi:hypothetical protein
MRFGKLFRILAGIGLAFLAGGCCSAWRLQQFLQTAVRTEGTVIGNLWHRDAAGRHANSYRRHAYPQVRFSKPDGGIIIFRSRNGSSPPRYELGAQVPVLYDRLDPHNAYIGAFGEMWAPPIGLAALGLAFVMPELCRRTLLRWAAAKEEWLRENGRSVQADVTEVALDRSYALNGINPYRIVCQWLDPATNQVHVFRSAYIWYDPTKFLPGKTLEVWMDPGNPRRYSVPTPFLPKAV